MSTGGKFLLVVNNGLQDKLLNAYDMLKDRINKYIMKKEPNYSEQDLAQLPVDGYLSIKDSVLPSLNMIEQTHNIFVNGSYKPCVSTTFEYVKVQPQGMVQFGQTLVFQPTQVGNFINDMVLHIKISGLRAKDNRDRVRYVAFPGHKLLENVQFVINNGGLVDQYNTDDINNYYLYELAPERKRNWCKLVGQELPKLGHLTSDPSFDMQREYRWIGDGFQTLKYSHDTLEMFIPLLFWFKDIKSALPSHIIPWGQMQVKVQLADVLDMVGFADYGGGGAYHEPSIDMCSLYINNIFTPDEIFQIYAQKFVFSLIRIHQQQRTQLTSDSTTRRILLNNLKYPIENLFFCFKPRENLNLSQHWYKTLKLTEKTYKTPVVAKNVSTVITGTVVSSTINSAILLSGLLSAVDGTYDGYDFIITGGSGYNNMDITQNRYIINTYNGTTKNITITTNWTGSRPDSTSTFELFTPQLAINTISYYEETPTVSSISLTVNDIEIWREIPELCYNSYLPHRFGGAMATPDDRGTYFIPFNLYPLHHQPTGSFNSSVGRELYLNIKSDVISSDFPADLVMSAKVINFLLVNNGGLTLKYI
jgi:hypothetical protein